MENAPGQVLIFIPDISGFTHFVKDTEINHSRHIVHELLESILESNQLDLHVSEIEGDAVLFYKMDALPSMGALLGQVQKMFVDFHSHLRKYEQLRICQCGACCSAVNLTLKFIVHVGEVAVQKIRDHTKLFGHDVILAHRLLKNGLTSDQYLLLTKYAINALEGGQSLEQFGWTKPEPRSEKYDDTTVEFKFLDLEALTSQIPPVQATDFTDPGVTREVFHYGQVVEAPLDLVFDAISDLQFRHEWQYQLKGSDNINHRITQPGSRHRCIIKGNESDPTMMVHDYKFSSGKITFVESNYRDHITVIYHLTRIGPSLTRVEYRFLIKPNLIKETVFRLFLKKRFLRESGYDLDALNKYCKELLVSGKQHPNRIELGELVQ